MDITVIVPLFNETESLPELAAWIDRVMVANGFSYEVLMVDDGSTDGSWDTVLSLAKEYPAIHGISFRRNYGKTAASTRASRPPRATSSSPWTRTCRTPPTKSRNSTV